MTEELLEVRVAQFVLEHLTLSQRSHVHLDTIGLDVFGKLELAQFLTLQHHPVAGRHAILLCRQANGPY